MLKVFFALIVFIGLSSPVLALTNPNEIVKTTVRDVTAEYRTLELGDEDLALTTPSPAATPAETQTINPPVPTTPSLGSTIGTILQGQSSSVSIDQIITLGEKIWDFIVTNRPTAQFQTIQSSIVPRGISNWTQLRGWQHPVSKVYRVAFQNVFGGNAGSFDYRITFVPGGSYKGKGKFLGQISFVPMNILLHTDRSLDVKAQLSEPLNFGTETNPVAAAEIDVSWTSPTTTRYQMNSASYFIYGTGEIQDLSAGTETTVTP
jgi:hypothetical protein